MNTKSLLGRTPAFVISSTNYPYRCQLATQRLSSVGFRDIFVFDQEWSMQTIKEIGVDTLRRTPGTPADEDKFVSETETEDGHRALCGLGAKHIAAWHAVASLKDHAWCVIVEDDICFHHRFDQLFPYFFSAVPPDFDLIWAGHSSPCRVTPIAINDRIVAGAFWTAHFYLITPRGAQRLLEARPIDAQIDWWIAEQVRRNVIIGYAFNYFDYDYERSGRFAYRTGGLAYQQKLPRA